MKSVARRRTYFLPYEELVMAHQNNGHTTYKKSLYNNKFIFSGLKLPQ
jgi:hypothetical protein